ncbi:unnamed protein product [Kuraishia capsulata CBS 1993]|uniref:Cupin type-2 domain-containing protein n=1 Tax=Kuraishia capsulata CBS 1993 TaxID=1382522 RepID=W6MIG6_9ASCO|nr:uncharacterized protein KUCA_T00002230001 [Kuraishia capsulata CBS 1993]CDK26259.1 unnamed protein product [Kuraishia capsulata CBS 1993]
MSTTTTETVQNTYPQTLQPQNEQSFLKSLEGKNVEPLWKVMNQLIPELPVPKAVPNIWRFNEIRPLLIDAGEIVSAEDADRRVLMLINPALREAPMCKTTDTLYAGLQHINTGETASAHRHSAFALRFIIEGNGGWTGVQGTRLTMERGDVLITPRRDWHDHGKEGNGPMIWLDGLDLPFFREFPVNFTDEYSESRYPSSPVVDTPLKYPWKDVQKALDSKPGDHAIYDYISKVDNVSPVSTVIGAQAERVGPKASSPPRLENSSFIFHVVVGKGYTVMKLVKGETKTIYWEGKDTFCIPSWTEFQHFNLTDETTYLYNFNDTPLLTNLAIHKSGKSGRLVE